MSENFPGLSGNGLLVVKASDLKPGDGELGLRPA